MENNVNLGDGNKVAQPAQEMVATYAKSYFMINELNYNSHSGYTTCSVIVPDCLLTDTVDRMKTEFLNRYELTENDEDLYTQHYGNAAFLSAFDDVEILLNLKNLEELNISFTTLKNPEVLGQMTWLKRLWMASCGMKYADCVDLSKSMSETKVCIWASHPTGENWRDSDRYRQMRDLQGMFYLD